MSDDLTEFVDAEFSITGAESPNVEQKLLAALQNVPGIAKTSVAQGRVDVHYDPITVTKKEIGEKIAARPN